MKTKQGLIADYGDIDRAHYIYKPLVGPNSKFDYWCYAHPNAAAAICGLIITAAYVFAGIVEAM